MKTEDLLIIGVLLLLLAEVTYLVAKLPRQAGGKKRLMFVDTSVLIDGRIIHVIKSGFVSDTVAIPRSVIGELQFLADNADPEKRSRARHGLDIVRELQHIEGADVQIFQDGSKAEEGVDERLLNLAKKHGGAVCTIDYNLNKVAAVEKIPVCNINDLAKDLRMAYLPGEKIMLELVQKGQDAHQAVGYLSDGTMVVVEQAAAQVGQAIEIEFIRSLQTAAGKMMFAKKVDSSSAKKQQSAQKPSGTKPASRRPAQNQNTAKSTNAAADATVNTNQNQNQNQSQSQSKSQSSGPTPNNNRRKPQGHTPTGGRRRPQSVEDSLMDLVDKQ